MCWFLLTEYRKRNIPKHEETLPSTYPSKGTSPNWLHIRKILFRVPIIIFKSKIRYWSLPQIIINYCIIMTNKYSSSSPIGTTAHCGLWPIEQCPSIFSYLPPNLSIFSLPALEDLFLLPLYIFPWDFPFFSSLPVPVWRSFWASCPPPFSLGDLTSLSFALLSILQYLLLCSSLLVLDSSDLSIPRFHRLINIIII